MDFYLIRLIIIAQFRNRTIETNLRDEILRLLTRPKTQEGM